MLKNVLIITQEDFDKAADDAKTQVPDKAANADKLALYGLFKQATVGDVNNGKSTSQLLDSNLLDA